MKSQLFKGRVRESSQMAGKFGGKRSPGQPVLPWSGCSVIIFILYNYNYCYCSLVDLGKRFNFLGIGGAIQTPR